MDPGGPSQLMQWTYGPRLSCADCGEEQSLDLRPKVDAYVRDYPVFCRACERRFSLWEALCRTLIQRQSISHVLGLVETESIRRVGRLDWLQDPDWIQSRRIVIDFGEILRTRIPDSLADEFDPSILRIEWRAWTEQDRDGSLPDFRGRFHALGIDAIPTKLEQRRVVLELSPRDEGVEEVWFEYWVVWVDRASEYRLVQLADAYAAFYEKRFNEAVIPAALAVETAVQEALDAIFEGRIDAPDQKALLGVNNDLRVHGLLPIAAGLVGYPQLPEVVRRGLKELGRRRNNMAHRGRVDLTKRGQSIPMPSEIEQAEMLAAALVAVEYAQLLAPAAEVGGQG